MDDLLSAIKRVGKTPCDKHRCSLREKCATEMLACSAFRLYVSTGRSVSPFEYIPIKESVGDRRRYKDAPEPTTEIYARMSYDNEDSDEQKDKIATRIIINGVESRTDVEVAWK